MRWMGRPVESDWAAELLLVGFAVGLVVLFAMVGMAMGRWS